jgi:hypothetical protein
MSMQKPLKSLKTKGGNSFTAILIGRAASWANEGVTSRKKMQIPKPIFFIRRLLQCQRQNRGLWAAIYDAGDGCLSKPESKGLLLNSKITVITPAEFLDTIVEDQ